ncbi:MAG: hypothetical protein QM757_45895 [Paludibaculum sp.]
MLLKAMYVVCSGLSLTGAKKWPETMHANEVLCRGRGVFLPDGEEGEIRGGIAEFHQEVLEYCRSNDAIHTIHVGAGGVADKHWTIA